MSADNMKYAQLQSFTLAGAGTILGDTTLTLDSMVQIDGVTLVTMADFGTKGYATIEPGNGTQEEAITFTGITQNANGTATLTGVSNQSFVAPYTETSGLAVTHPGGVIMIITNTAGYYNRFANKDDDETILGLWNFPNGGSNPTIGGSYVAPTTDLQIATKKYVDDVAVAGAPDATTGVKGIVQLATQAQTDAGTATGSTGASIVATPAVTRSRLLSDYVADTGAANAYAIAPSPVISAYTTGQIFTFKAANTNTTASTLNVNTLGAKAIKKTDGTAALIAGDIVAGQLVIVEYDGTNFQMLSPVANLIAKKLQSATTVVDVSAATAPSTGQVLKATSSTAATWQTLPTPFTTATKGTASKNMADASTTQNIAHGLGTTPAQFTIICTSPGGLALSLSGNSMSTGITVGQAATTASFAVSSDTGGAITNYQTGVVTADATNIIITWTKTASPTGTASIAWQAFA